MPKRRDETVLRARLTRITMGSNGIAVTVVRQARRVVTVATAGLIIVSSAHYGSPYLLGGTPQLPLNSLDALLAETVRNVTHPRSI